MELYIFKSAVILTILYGFYKLVLENESMHVFKRFYLLGSLPVAFLIPLVTFTSYVEVPVSSAPVFIGNSLTMPMAAPEVSVNLWPYVIWGLYALGMVFFSIKFGKNLNQLISKIRNNPRFTRDSIHHILLKTPVIPHTFLNYVFLNKQKFESREIPDEVIQHEHVHAKQKHSIDILAVELLQIVFWFNPLLYSMKRSIKLNHEFLADRAVLNQGVDPIAYQKLLLAFSSHAITPALANSINYSFIKKRFTVMKKQTSTKTIWLRSILILPLLALLVYGFSTKKDVVLQQNNSTQVNNVIQAVTIYIDQNSVIYLNGKPIAFNDIDSEVNKLNTHLSVEEKQKYVRADISFEKESDMDLATKIGNKLFHSNIWQSSHSSLSAQRKFNLNSAASKMIGLTIEEAEAHYQKMISDGENFKNSENGTNNPWSIKISDLDNVEHIQIHINSNEEFTLNGHKTIINTIEEQLKLINPNLSEEDRKKRVVAHIYSDGNTKMGFITDIKNELIKYGIHRFVSHPLEKKNNIEPLIPQEQATKAEIKEYNTLAKKYNTMSRDNIRIITAEVDRMKFIFSKMTAQQKENGESFPSVLPAQPPTPPAPKVGKTSSIQSAPEVPTIYTVPQPPPAPNDDPIEYIKELTKAGAMFYIGPHRYSSAEVIEIAKKSKDFKLDVSNYPKVNLPGC